jgi:GDP-L-fucose synthase
VTGGAGFLGVNLVKRLVSLGATVRATIHTKGPLIHDDRVEYVKCNLLNKEDCRRIVDGIEYVFLCASNTSGAGGMESTSLSNLAPNITMGVQMLEASYAARVKKVLFVSSTTVYPPRGDEPIREEEAFDDDPFEKYFLVGWTNRFFEVLCRFYSEKLRDPMPTVVLRPSNIYGEYDNFDPSHSHVVPALIRKIVDRQSPIEVWGSGNDVRDLIYVDDFVDAAILAVEKMEEYCPINIGAGEGYSVRQILQVILDIDGYPNAEVVFSPSKPAMIPVRLVDTARAEALLGFKAKTELREGLRKTIQWYRQQMIGQGGV